MRLRLLAAELDARDRPHALAQLGVLSGRAETATNSDTRTEQRGHYALNPYATTAYGASRGISGAGPGTTTAPTTPPIMGSTPITPQVRIGRYSAAPGGAPRNGSGHPGRARGWPAGRPHPDTFVRALREQVGCSRVGTYRAIQDALEVGVIARG